MLSSFKYRLYPTKEQEARLNSTLASLCDLYNELRREKVDNYRENKINLSKTDLRKLTLEKRRVTEKLKQIHSQVVQNVADRVSASFNNFFEKRARFPKKKKYKNYRSFVYPQSGFNVNPTPEGGHKLYLSGIGYVRAFIHRPMLGKVNRLSIKCEAGECYAIFLMEMEDKKIQDVKDIPNDKIRGGDVGLEKFIVLDDSSSNEYPQFLRLSEQKITQLQRHLSKKRKGSRRRKRLAFRLAQLHLHVKRQREDYQNKLVSTLFNKETDVLVLEKLSIQNMLQNHNLARSLADASFGKFASKCINKGKMLGKHVIFVDPWGTTQFCYNCLEWVPKDLSEREHNCPNCKIKLPRDLNSAKLIKWLGIPRRSCPPSDGGSPSA
ncbi:MAG: transposase, partial [Nitrososphaerota archaeon]|nr:transposase [Nitrososphaerota archaeon]